MSSSDGARTSRLLSRADVAVLLDRAGLEARRSLGQNFVVDPNTIRRIVREAGVRPGDRVLEVGPGLGSLTLGLVEAGARITAVEKDPRVAELLRTVVPPEVDVVVADALEVDLDALTATDEVGAPPWRLVANLPYNVATPILIRVLEEAPRVARLLVMVQYEVAARIVAGPGSKVYGIPSLRVAQHATARIVGKVGPEVFHPRPRVTSALVALERRPEPLVSPVDVELMWRLVRTAFGQRRKTIRRSLAGLVRDADFEAARLDSEARPERLDLVQFAALADAVVAAR